MVRTRTHRFWIVICGLGAASLFFPAQAEARSWKHKHDYHDRSIRFAPSSHSFVKISVGGRPYHYRDGHYFNWTRRGFQRVAAPIGAVVAYIPQEHKTVVIDGVVYHNYDGVYYKGGAAGYTVVPVQTMTVNVPNANGSYTPVVLQSKTDGGYIGPQGEFYPEFPKIEQLSAMYAKN